MNSKAAIRPPDQKKRCYFTTLPSQYKYVVASLKWKEMARVKNQLINEKTKN